MCRAGTLATERIHSHVRSPQQSLQKVPSIEEYTLQTVRQRLLQEWHPEYEPESILPPHETGHVISERATRIALSDIIENAPVTRLSKIVCTLGPAYSTEEQLGSLLDGGLNISRFNFSHGSHDAHAVMLERFRYDLGRFL